MLLGHRRDRASREHHMPNGGKPFSAFWVLDGRRIVMISGFFGQKEKGERKGQDRVMREAR
jgi:hypothetical protein